MLNLPITKKKDSRKENLKRVNEIYKVLRKYELGYLLEKKGLKKKKPISVENELDLLDTSFPVRVRMVLQELGTTYIKLGQTLSTRPDLVGKELAQELVKLQDDNPPIPFSEVEKIIEKELKKPINTIFTEFNPEPIGSASIGQVHTAKLDDGTPVAVKIQKTGVEHIVKSDLVIMKFLGDKIDKYVSSSRIYNIPSIVREFERSILKEIDYTMELANMEHLTHDFRHDRTIHVPKTYPQYSTSKVLTMELIDGKKVSDVITNPTGHDTKLIAKRGVNSYFKQIMINGFFHADPHPSNIYVMDNNIVCFLDEGMMGTLDKEFRTNLAELFIFFIDKDVNNMINQLIYMGILNEHSDIRPLKEDVNDLMSKYYGAELGNMTGGMNDLINIMVKYNIQLPREFVLMARGIAMIEETGLKLDPDFDVVGSLKPLARKIIHKKFSVFRIFDYMKDNFVEVEHLMKSLPHSISKTFYKLEQGDIQVELVHKDLDRITNKLSMALIIAALLIGSSIVMLTNKGIMILDLPFLGFIGFTLALILAVWTVIIARD